MIYLMGNSTFILTDSGGIQEEAPSLDKAVLIMRETTERTEGVTNGCARLIGCETKQIVKEASLLINEPTVRKEMEAIDNPYGDGQASEKILRHIVHFFDATG